MAEAPLAGIGVLVTRPRHQAQELVDAIEARGGTAILFPALEIVPRSAAAISADVAGLDNPDITIFVSPNAVRYGLAFAGRAALTAIGPATANALEAAGRHVAIRSAAGFDSEHLLASDALQDVAGKVIRIVRGQHGRDLLADTLVTRGAHVDFLPVYDRAAPHYEPAELIAIDKRWRAGEISVVTVMSVETLRNLIAILPESCRRRLALTRLVTPAARVIKEALNLLPGIPTTLARGPQVDHMVFAISEPGSRPPG